MRVSPLPKQTSERHSLPWVRRLHIVTLSSFAIAQPLYDMIAREPNFLVAHGATASDLILFTLVVSLVVPGLLVALGWLAHLVSAKAASWVDLLGIYIASSLLALGVVNRIGMPGWFAIVVAAALGGAAAVVYQRFHTARTWLTALALAILVFPVVFLFFSPARLLLFPPTVDAEPVERGDGAHVVLIVFDELPVTSLMNEQRMIDGTRYPGFAELAQISHWFRNATTVAPYTNESVPAMLTGRLPVERRLNTLADFPANLFTLLASSHDLKVVETLYGLCPGELNLARAPGASLHSRFRVLLSDSTIAFMHVITPVGLDSGLPPISNTLRDFAGVATDPANDPLARANDSAWIFQYFLDQITPASRPTLHFLHCTVPHPPWKYLPSGTQYGPVGLPKNPHGLSDQIFGNNQWSVLQVWQRHLMQVQYADLFLSSVMARLRETGTFDESILIVTSDHGSAFIAGEPRRPISEVNACDLLSVPLFVKTPGQLSGSTSDQQVQSIDILPTIAEVLEVEVPWAMHGRSVFDPDHNPQRVDIMIDQQGSATGPYDPHPDDKYETLRRMIHHFGTGEKTDGLFRFGPYGSVVGRTATDFDSGRSSTLRAVLEQGWAFDEVDLESSFLPARVVGRLQGLRDAAAEVFLAVQVNSVVRATTRTFDHQGNAARFTAMLPEHAFRAGANHVELFTVSGEPDRPELARVELAPSTICRLSGAGSEEVIECSDGWRSPVVPLAVRGRVHFNGRVVHGWAADIPGGRPATRILVFRGRELLMEASTGEPQHTLAERDERLANCGYEFHIQESTLADDELGSLRFYAVAGTSTSKLHVFP